MMMALLSLPIQNEREVLVVPTLMMMVLMVLSQMRGLKDLTFLLMVKVVAGLHAKLTQLIG
jgi:hypothetical protein